jgi:hypothetical protein
MRNLMTDVRLTLRTPVKVKKDGRSRSVSTQEGALLMLREKALRGDARALDRLLDFASRFNNEPAAEAMERLAPDDEVILAAFTAEAAGIAAPVSPPPQPRQIPRRRLREPSNDEPENN